MRWPFVSRAAFDTMRESRDLYRDLYTSAQARADRLASAVVERPAPQPAKRDDMAEVIDLKAGHDLSLKRHLWSYVKQQRRDKVDETAIMNAVLHWQDDEEGVPA